MAVHAYAVYYGTDMLSRSWNLLRAGNVSEQPGVARTTYERAALATSTANYRAVHAHAAKYSAGIPSRRQNLLRASSVSDEHGHLGQCMHKPYAMAWMCYRVARTSYERAA